MVTESLFAKGDGFRRPTRPSKETPMTKPKIAVLGSGQVAQTLAKGFLAHGYPVRVGNRTPTKLEAFSQETGIEVVAYEAAVLDSAIVVLSVKGLCLEGIFKDVSFDVRAGEILGLAGLVGSGRSNIAETIFGVTPATAGSIEINGKPVKMTSPRIAMEHGMAFLTEDRKQTGCFLLLDVQENTQIAVLQNKYVKNGFVQQAQLSKDSTEMSNRLRVRTPDMQEPVINLSGGNQQKVLISRWLLTEPKILILDEPTRGIDVGAKAEIHKLISRLAGQGVAVIMISSEMPEVLGMSDRIMVVHEGRVTGFLDRSEATQVKIMELASH
jgi:ribose transport system ATP-binding protein/inositol transport system ATP-binding protein